MKLCGQGCCTGIITTFNTPNHLFNMLCLYTNVFLAYVLRSFIVALIAVIKLLLLRCVLMLLSSFNSKFLSKLTPPIFTFLCLPRVLYFILISFLNYENTRYCVCSEWTLKPMIYGKQQTTHLENKCTPLEYKFNTPAKNLTVGRIDIQSILHIRCNGR